MRQAAPEKQDTTVLHLPLFFSSFAFFVLIVGLPIYGKSLGANAMEIGGLFSIFTLANMILRPIIGRALDRFGRRPFFIFAVLSYTIAMGLFAVAGGLGGLYLARLMQGIAAACLWTSARTITADLATPAERGKAMGRMQEMSVRGGLVGMLLGFPVMGAFPGLMGWQVAFLSYTALAAMGAWLAWKSVPETRPTAPALQTETRPISRQLLNRQLLRLMVIVFTTGFSAAMILPLFLIFLQDKFSTDMGSLGLAFLPFFIVMAVLPSHLGKLSDRFGRALLMAIGLMGAGLVSLLLPHLPSLVWLGVLYTCSAIGWAMANPAEAAMVADLAGSDTRGQVYGLYAFADSFGATLGPLLGGWLYDAVGHAVPFYLNGLILGASALWVVVLLRQPVRGAKETEAV